jgi:hypothetical protein
VLIRQLQAQMRNESKLCLSLAHRGFDKKEAWTSRFYQ